MILPPEHYEYPTVFRTYDFIFIKIASSSCLREMYSNSPLGSADGLTTVVFSRQVDSHLYSNFN